MPIGPIGIIGPQLRERCVHALINVYWTLENPRFLKNAVSAYRQHTGVFPEHRLLFLCNAPGKWTCSKRREFQRFFATIICSSMTRYFASIRPRGKTSMRSMSPS
jgi:hypothetical protein